MTTSDQYDDARFTFTQHSIAWPNTVDTIQRNGVTDDISISGPASVKGSITFSFFTFNDGSTGLRTEAYEDSLPLLFSTPVQDVLHAIDDFSGGGSNGAPVAPEFLRQWLQDAGFVPSSYHVRGLKGLPEDHPARVQTREAITTDAVQRYSAAMDPATCRATYHPFHDCDHEGSNA